jgi:cytochrome c peroxidase
VDYSLNKEARSIFDKGLFFGQNAKGIFRRVKDAAALAEIEHVGKLLFYDPILSGNNLRACASCHKPTQFFTDTVARTAFHFNHSEFLPRNTPSLIGATYNHLVMLDGKHYTLQHQSLGVISNAVEMSGATDDVLKKVLGCREYKTAFQRLLKLTPQESEVTMEHLASAITLYYSRFSDYYSPFDDAMNMGTALEPEAVAGFNVFMSKAQCATCHFAPQFNGVKPPYIGSEFEVLGVPQDASYAALSPDKGRWDVNPAVETAHAFRTGTVRNAAHTAPYMHNGAFRNLSELIDFYDGGGGAGHGLEVPNQTLSPDSLHLTPTEKYNLTAFIHSLNERVRFETPPTSLPRAKNRALNTRKVGGVY